MNKNNTPKSKSPSQDQLAKGNKMPYVDNKKAKGKTYTANQKWYTSAVIPALFAIFAAYMLIAKNSDYLYMCQENSLFVADSSFFDMQTRVPGGFMAWIGCFLTQLFYTPWVGAVVLILLWAAIYFLTIKAFRISSPYQPLALIIPAALLCSVIGIGYWFYYIKIQGYWFTETVGVLMMALALYISTLIKNRWANIAWMVVWTFIGYIAFGWYALLGTLCMGIRNYRSVYHCGAAALSIIAVPIICYQFYTQTILSRAWIAAFPLFQVDIYTSTVLIIPFIVIALAFILFAYFRLDTKWEDIRTKSQRSYLTQIALYATIFGIGACVWNSHISDFNYHSEMRMYRAIDEARWNDVLSESADVEIHPTREQVLFRNIALMNTGKLGTSMFRYDNKTIPPATFDSLGVHMVQTNGPITYMNYARTNFATRWCIENGVEYGFTIDRYKILVRSSLVNGEYDVAQKYINILKKTMNYKKWAERYEAVNGDSTKIAALPELTNICELHNHFRSVLDGDEGLIEMYLLNYFSHTQNKDSKFLQELTLAFALISKDIEQFWPKFFLYATLHEQEEMPIHYQEAAFLYGNLEHQVDISTMPFNQELIVNRYNNFQQMSQALLRQGMDTEQVGEAMRPAYGDTFWWFYFFCRNIQSY